MTGSAIAMDGGVSSGVGPSILKSLEDTADRVLEGKAPLVYKSNYEKLRYQNIKEEKNVNYIK